MSYFCAVKALVDSPQRTPQLIVPATEGIKYAGSKLRLLPYIMQLVSSLDGVHTVLDAFAGSTRVSQALYQTGRYAVTSVDISDWSEVFGRCFLLADREPAHYAALIDRLNALEPRRGWFSEHYGGSPDDGPGAAKRPFQLKNTERLDAVRDEIDRLTDAGELDPNTRAVLIASLILALDRVDSTMGHFSSYLRRWSRRSYDDLHLRLPRLLYNEGSPRARVVRSDIFSFLADGAPRYDLAYLDPPYGSNNARMPSSRVRYASYYHIWTTVVRNDRPQLFGKAQRREDSRDAVSASVFEDFRTLADGHSVAADALDRLLDAVAARYVLLSYSSSGRADVDELRATLARHGRLRQTLTIDYAHNVMARMSSTREWMNADSDHREFLFLLEK